MRILGFVLLSPIGLLLVNAARGDDFALRDGDKVAFLGDSITAARTYGKLIENYTLLRYPNRRVQFINVGQGGDTAAGGRARLDRDVFSRGVTVLTVAYGINDIGWGLRANEEHKQRYLQAIGEIVRECGARNVRVFICSAAVTGADPAKSENDFLQTMCDEGLKIAREGGGQGIDVQRAMREIQKRVWQFNAKIEDTTKKESLHTADGVHLNDLGQTAMAYAILKGLGAPADVSSVVIDAREGKLLASAGCQVSQIAKTAEGIEFTRRDEGLPLNAQTFFALHFRFVPIHEQLNRYLLTVKGLSPGNYEVAADNRKVSSFSAEQLENGINISSATADPWLPGGPWDAQANILHSLTESRDKLDLSALLAKGHLPDTTLTREHLIQAEKANAAIETMQRAVAQPRPFRFVLRKVPPGESAKKSGG